MSVVGHAQVTITGVKEESELGEKLLLSGDVSGQYQGAHQVCELCKLCLRQIFGQAGLNEARDG